MSHEITFQCPRCHETLSQTGRQLRCSQCDSQTIPVRAGIPSFTDNQDYFFGEIPRSAMIDLAASIDRVGWTAAFDAMCEQQHAGMQAYIRQYIADASRANWKYLLDLPEDGRALDFGCGWGETTLSLARSLGHVVSMDLTFERLLLLQARSRDLGVDRLTLVHGGDVLPLPFQNETFDVIVLNGVLEWVPVTGSGSPRQCQLAMLRELRRILKPQGQLYVGIENRVGLKYFLGKLDEHSQLKYTSLMPRWLAQRWSLTRTGKPYRTYTYTRRGYERLLREAGFGQVAFHCPYPDYREFDRIASLTTANIKQFFNPRSLWKRCLLQVPGCPPLLKWTVPSFSIVAGKTVAGRSRLERIVGEVSARTSLKLNTPPILHSKPIGEVTVRCARDSDSVPFVLLTIAETQTAVDSRCAAATFLDAVWKEHRLAGTCMDAIPQIYGHGVIRGSFFSVEELKQGESWRTIDDYRDRPGRAIVAAAEWLIDFQKSTQSEQCWEPRSMQAHVNALAAQAKQLLAAGSEAPLLAACPQQNADYAQEEACRSHDVAQIPVVINHGDFHLDNVLFSPTDNQLAGVIDWDLAERRGLPLVDLIYLLLWAGMDIQKKTYCEAVDSLLNPESLAEEERAVLLQYEATFNLPSSYRSHAIKVAILQNIVTLAVRRPAAFRRLRNELSSLPEWLTASSPIGEPDQVSSSLLPQMQQGLMPIERTAS